MIRKNLAVWLTLLASLGADSALADDTPPDTKPSPDVAWLVIGVQPKTAQLEIDEPRMHNGVVVSFHYRLDAFRPVDGFILVKAHPGTVYAVAASSLMAGSSIFGVRYKPCGQVPSFQAAGGKVVYFTTMTYRGEGAHAPGILVEGHDYSQDMEGARAFMKAHYPGLADSLEQGQMEKLEMGSKCP